MIPRTFITAQSYKSGPVYKPNLFASSHYPCSDPAFRGARSLLCFVYNAPTGHPAVFLSAVGRDAPRTSGLANSDRKSTRLNSSHSQISYAVFCLKKKKKDNNTTDESDIEFNQMHLRQRQRERRAVAK